MVQLASYLRRVLGTSHYLLGGGGAGALYLGGSSLFFELHFEEGRFLKKNSSRGGLRVFEIVSIDHQSLNYQIW